MQGSGSLQGDMEAREGQGSPVCLEWWSVRAPGCAQGLKNEAGGHGAHVCKWEMT